LRCALATFLNLRERERRSSPESSPRKLLFSDDLVAFGITSMYESLMEDTLIDGTRISRSRRVTEWLAIPVDVLTLKFESAKSPCRRAGRLSYPDMFCFHGSAVMDA